MTDIGSEAVKHRAQVNMVTSVTLTRGHLTQSPAVCTVCVKIFRYKSILSIVDCEMWLFARM